MLIYTFCAMLLLGLLLESWKQGLVKAFLYLSPIVHMLMLMMTPCFRVERQTISFLSMPCFGVDRQTLSILSMGTINQMTIEFMNINMNEILLKDNKLKLTI